MSVFARLLPLLFLGLNLGWLLLELWLGRRRRSGSAGADDHGTLRRLHLAIYGGIAAAVTVAMGGWMRMPTAWHVPLLGLGLALIAGGLALRVWAIRVLARFFTVDVYIHDDHRLVRSGPYRRLRHPSYTGALLAFLGLALGLANWAALPLLLLPVGWSFLRRIQVEEAALAQRFPDEYADYALHSWRLLPWVW